MYYIVLDYLSSVSPDCGLRLLDRLQRSPGLQRILVLENGWIY